MKRLKHGVHIMVLEMSSIRTLQDESCFWDSSVRGICIASACCPLLVFAGDITARAFDISFRHPSWRNLIESGILAGLICLILPFLVVVPAYLLAVLTNSTLKSLNINPQKLWVAAAVGGLTPITLILPLLRARRYGGISCYPDLYDSAGTFLACSIFASLLLQSGAVVGVRSLVHSHPLRASGLRFRPGRFAMNLIWTSIVVASSIAIALSKGYGQAEVSEFAAKWFGGQLVTLLLILTAEYFYTNLLFIELENGEDKGRETANLTPAD